MGLGETVMCVMLGNRNWCKTVLSIDDRNEVSVIASESWGIKPVSTSASTLRIRSKRWLWIPVFFLAITHWDIALPTVNIHYSKDAKGELRYIWNVQGRVFKGAYATRRRYS